MQIGKVGGGGERSNYSKRQRRGHEYGKGAEDSHKYSREMGERWPVGLLPEGTMDIFLNCFLTNNLILS